MAVPLRYQASGDDGDYVQVLEGVRYGLLGVGRFSISNTGLLPISLASPAPGPVSSFDSAVQIRKHGGRTKGSTVVFPPAVFGTFALSPDEKSLAI